MATLQRNEMLKMVQMSMLVALVVVLQMLSAVIPPIGGVSITLTLVPVVIGAILFGVQGGAILGFFFGAIVLINCITGVDFGGNMMWNANPIMTAIICFTKGIAAGVVPALLYKLVNRKKETEDEKKSEKRKLLSAITAAASAPIVNTSLFVIGALLFFTDTLVAWKAGTDASNMATYIVLYLAGINFLVEFMINLILSPAIMRIVAVAGKKKRR